MLSVVANLTPWSDHNQSPRNMYQCQVVPFLSVPFVNSWFSSFCISTFFPNNLSDIFSPKQSVLYSLFYCCFYSRWQNKQWPSLHKQFTSEQIKRCTIFRFFFFLIIFVESHNVQGSNSKVMKVLVHICGAKSHVFIDRIVWEWKEKSFLSKCLSHDMVLELIWWKIQSCGNAKVITCKRTQLSNSNNILFNSTCLISLSHAFVSIDDMF